MSDFISRKALLEKLEKSFISVNYHPDTGDPFTAMQAELYNEFLAEMIKEVAEQSAAYDVEKVVEELEAKRFEYQTRIDRRSGECYFDEAEKIRTLSERMYGIEQALEIIKGRVGVSKCMCGICNQCCSCPIEGKWQDCPKNERLWQENERCEKREGE